MAHSIELLLDAHSEAAVRAQWQILADAGLPSQARVAAARINPGADEPLRELASSFPLDGVIGAPLVFGGPRLTLARLVVPSAALLDLHTEVYRRSLAHLDGEAFAHCSPGRWTPHLTVGRRYTAEQIGPALAAVNSGGNQVARIVGLRRWDSDARVDHLLVG
jgi:hypothetical protein